MVISKKPLHFIVALLVSVLPLVVAANNPDSTAVQTVAVVAETEGHT